MTPHHVEYYVRNEILFRVLFRWEGGKVGILLVLDDGSEHDCGNWPDVFKADEAARKKIDELAESNRQNPLLDLRRGGANLIVTFDHANGKYTIVAGYQKPYKFVETGMFFDSKKQAAAALVAAMEDK